MKSPGLAGWLGIPSVCGIATIEVLASRMAPCPRPDPSREKIPGVVYCTVVDSGDEMPVALSTVKVKGFPGASSGHCTLICVSEA